MQSSLKLLLFALLFLGFGELQPTSAQSAGKQLIATKRFNNKQKGLNINSFFKLKTKDGEKIKAKLSALIDNGLVTLQNDTVLFQDIRWIRIQRDLNKLEKGLAIAGTFAGSYLSIGAIPAGLVFLFIESNPWVLLAPVATLSSFVIGFKTLRGKKYKTKYWKLTAKPYIIPSIEG